jgi:hypothetical protein
MTCRTTFVLIESQEPKSAASLGLHFAKTKTAADAVNTASSISYARFA